MTKIYTEKEDRRRYHILGLDYNKKAIGGIIRFNGLRASTLKDLMDNNFIDPNETQNYSPTVKQIYDFISKYPNDFHAHGYLVVNQRDDRRITLEGVESHGSSDEDTLRKIANDWLDEINNEPDEYLADENSVWLWWD